MILNPLLAAVLFLPSLGFAQDKAEKNLQLIQKAPAQEKIADKPPYPILDQVFKAGLNQDQLKALGEHPTAERQAAAMTPEQKISVRKSLHEVEEKAKTPEDLKQIARGYLILDERQESAGQNAVRVAARLQELEPKSSAGFSLAAGGYYQMNDFLAAARAAKEALRRNPEDPNAITLLALSRDRVGGRNIDARAIEKLFSFTKRDDPNLPIKLPVKMPGKSTAVPALLKKEPVAPLKREPSPLLPLTVPVGVSLIGYGVYRSRQTKTSETGLNPEPTSPPTPGATLTNTIIKAAIGATIIAGAGYLAAPYLPAALSASGQAAPALAPMLAGGGAAGGAVALEQSAVLGAARAGIAAGGTVAIAKTASDYYTNAKHKKEQDSYDSRDFKKISRQSKPVDAPRGTKPINRSGLNRGITDKIKQKLGLEPTDWTGIDPEGNVISTGPGGKSINHGPWKDCVQ